tara:strand:+ start:1246 stop:1755 length:510 start_codon:yes stop_codon:yes gene_type:complete
MVLNCLINNTANAKSDDYATPAHVWKDIEEFIPKNDTIYVPFYLDGGAGEIFKQLGCTDVIHKNVDFFTNTLLYSVVIDNPPFSKKKQILSKLRHDCTPFILLVPPSTLCTQYFRNLFNNDKDIQFIIPRTRIHFISGTENDNRPSNCPFDTIYLCWRMNLPREINWID